jgi:hypothetical protein
MNQLKLKDIPSDLLAKIDEQFYHHPRIRQMRIEQQVLQNKGMLMQALDIGKEVEELHTRAIYAYMQMAEDEATNLHLEDVDLDKEDEEFLRTAEIALFMACDIINCCLIDMNDTLHRKDKTLNYEAFNDMKSIIELVKAKLNYLRGNSTYLQNEKWGDLCDNAYKMLMSKAKRMRQEERKKKSKK